eukprot:INCI8243.6.p1 GENE.INCI8243.6~~INCI8243.6.p1  ORF type:complete len:670 (+),score=93.98 INCI8243.6:207-2216(+)
MITLLLSLLLALAQQASASENSSTSRGPSPPPAPPSLAFLPDVAERDVARLSPTVSASAAATLFPPYRVSRQSLVELWVAVADAGVCGDYKRAGSGAPQCVASVTATGPSPSGAAPLTTTTNWTFSPSATATPWARLKVAALNVSQWHGRIQIEVTVAAAAATGVAVAEPLLIQRWQYEVINTSTASTRLIDGAFIDIVHWSGSEGQPFNEALRQMTAADWRGQIMDMAAAGIRTATIQALFINNLYPGSPAISCDNYTGVALYPSDIYPRDRADFATAGGGVIDAEAATNFTDSEDKLEAIFSAADAANVSIFVGLGNFAWFTFNDEALTWAQRVAAEVWERYGRHRSFYGWYAASEMAGDFSSGGPNTTQTVLEMTAFFDGFGNFSESQLPALTGNNDNNTIRAPSLLPVMLAINSGDVIAHAHAPAGGWVRVAAAVDVLAVFGFARIPNSPTAAQMQSLCAEAGAAFWVDMELFSDDMSAGLVPKTFADVRLELEQYNDAPQIGCAYEYTAQMSGPSHAPEGLQSLGARDLYSAYQQYYLSVLRGDHPWPPCLTPDSNGTLTYTLSTADPGLCAPAVGSNVSHVHYVGRSCAPDDAAGTGARSGGETGILWTSMATSDPRSGLQPSDCAWSRTGNPQDVAGYFGTSCGGAPPTRVLLPTRVCTTST